MKKEVTITMEIITPEVASEYLSHNTKNRPLCDRRVKEIAREMKEGNWRPNPSEPISFAEDGTLINGQHRLQGVILAGIPICMAVLRGADKKDFEVIDTGKQRSAADLLALQEVENCTVIAALIKYYFHLRKGCISTTRTVKSNVLMGITNKTILDEYKTSPDTYQEIVVMSRRVYTAGRFLSCSEAGGIIAFLIKEKNHDIQKVKAFFDELASGGKYRVISYLRTRLIRAANTTDPKGKLDMQGRRVLISRAWNLFIAGKGQEMINYRTGDKYHFD